MRNSGYDQTVAVVVAVYVLHMWIPDKLVWKKKKTLSGAKMTVNTQAENLNIIRGLETVVYFFIVM